MINNMVMEKNNGQMDQGIKETMLKVRNMVKDYCNLLMDHIMMENLIIMIYMEKVLINLNIEDFMYGKIKENMKENGLEIKCMDLEQLNGQMEEFMKESIIMRYIEL